MQGKLAVGLQKERQNVLLKTRRVPKSISGHMVREDRLEKAVNVILWIKQSQVIKI